MTDDATLRDVFTRVRTVAVVGFSANPARPAHFVSVFLQDRGYRVIPVNPGLAGQEILGETVRATLAEVPEEVDMVDVFRRSEAVPEVVEEALDRWPSLPVLWLQLGVHHPEAVARARAAGVTVVEDRCPKMEYPRLFGATMRDRIAG